jgi:Na+-driven multidrug efflux pump
MPYVSQNLGANNLKRAKQAVVRGMFITIALAASIGALSAIFSGQLSSILSSNPAAIKYSQQKMVIISSTYFICGINEIMGSALRGMGRSTLATGATLVYMCLFRFVWVYLIFPLCRNLTFLYLVWPIGWVLSLSTLLIFYFPTVKRLREKAERTALNQTL